MQQKVLVKSCNPDGTALVLHVRESACSGDCHKCSGCGAAKETVMFTAVNPIGAEAGDWVTVTSDPKPVLAAAAVLYLLPVLLFFAGYLLGYRIWQAGGLTGCAGFAAGIALAAVYDRMVIKKQKIVYTITGLEESFRSREIEDSDID